MKGFIILIITFFGLITLSETQNLTSSTRKVEKNKNDVPSTFTVTVINIQGLTSALNCAIILKGSGYASADISVSTNANNIFTVTLSNFIVGRTSDIQCGIVSLPAVTNVKIGLSVRPATTAHVCSNVSAVIAYDRNIIANVVVQFTYALTSAATINCSSTNLESDNTLAPSSGVSIFPMTLQFKSTASAPEVVTCTFNSPPANASNNFQFSVNFIKAAIYFSPATIVTDTPIISLNLFINFQNTQAQTFSCYALTNANGLTCANISSSPKLTNWIITSSVQFPANPLVMNQTVSLMFPSSSPGTSVNFAAVCCNSNFIATANVAFKYPNNDNVLQASTTATNYTYIQFYEMSTCPCDLTVAVCDVNCCCDPYCNCSSNSVTAINGPYGGYFNDKPIYSCAAPYQVTTPPYHALLCVQFNTSNIVGYYYNDTAIIRDSSAFQTAINSATRNSFQFSPATQDISSAKIPAYSAQSLVQTYLYLPRQVPDSTACNLYNPVFLLQPYDSSCPYDVTTDNCASLTDPRLSYLHYLISTTALETNCINSSTLTNINSNTPVYTFYVDSNSSRWDNGYTLPSSPSLSNTDCTNVVTSVNYTIAYNSSGIVYINAYVSLGSVNLPSVIYQRFVLSFLNTNISPDSLTYGSFLTAQQSIANTAATQTKTSGLYGYEDGLPVLLADGSTMKTLSPTVSGLCQPKVVGSPILFHKDSFMQCKYSFTSSVCANRRTEAQAYLDSILTNQSVAIYGNPSTSADYVTVTTIAPASITGTGTKPSRSTNSSIVYPIDSMVNFCENVTTGVSLIIYYARQGKARGQYIHNILGVKKEYIMGNLSTFSPSGSAQVASTILTSTVQFILLSANIQGTQSTDDVTQRVCYFDVCIEELLYPWLLNYEGKQGFYELGFGVILLGLAVFLLVTTDPWW